jgi:hypothetical protein
VTAMRLWFRRRERKGGKPRSAREQVRNAHGGSPHPKRHNGPPRDDPIKNWESPDQSFLREAGDPFLDG